MLSFLKNWTLPVAITVGTILYLLFAYVPALDSTSQVLGPLCETLLPISIFFTLFITFSKVDYHLMRFTRWHGAVLVTQILFVAALFFAAYFTNGAIKLTLDAILVCVIAPCASASPVVTAKLGGNLTTMTTFVLLSSIVMAVLIPLVFPILEPTQGTSFIVAFLLILRKLALVLLLPLLLGAIVRHWIKPLYEFFKRTPDLGFYCWSFSLAITSGITVKNILHSEAGVALLIAIAVLTVITAFIQFRIGRALGNHFGEKICCGQAMFQKNTGLAIWIAYVYLSPVASIGAGCYVLWQNIINSYELWQLRHEAKA